MYRLISLLSLIAVAGGAGGLAHYLLLSLPSGEKRNLFGALRFLVAGGITAYVVPLFLSLAQSSLVKGIVDFNGPGQAYSDILIFIGFCVVAGFASRAFMDTMTSKLMQMQQEVRKVDDKVRQLDKIAVDASDEARAADNKALEAIELTEENADRVAEVVGKKAKPSDAWLLIDEPARQAPSPRAKAIASSLSSEELRVLGALKRYSTRTQTGVARDAGVPRNQVSEIIENLSKVGLAQFTTSPNTHGLRVGATPLGIDVHNAALPPEFVIVDNQASREETPSAPEGDK
jgi:DNA-binding MarR family transcriptional regulator/outer membrane murein-binding lipoprotein Lpp